MKRLPSNYNALVRALASLEQRSDNLQREIIRKAKALEIIRKKLQDAKTLIERKEKLADPTFGDES